jgi:lipoprotein-anchoring transpeptidase ErfK/SrfK
MSLKVVRGPFDALINLSRHELTLLLRDPSGLDRYAGRFMVGVGHDQPNLEGDYVVHDMTVNPRYYSPDGMNVEAGDPRNPLGSAWIGLTDRIGIHGTNNPQTIGHDGNPGSICVGEGDIQDLCSLLSVGSRVKIVR